MSPSPNASPDGTLHGRVATAIDTYDLLKKGDRVLVAVSGGPDSVALLHTLCALVDRYEISLAVAHLNHGLRSAAQSEQAFVADLARELALPFHTTCVDVRRYQGNLKLSLEDAARRVRYTYLYAEAKHRGFTKIAVGHHADDTAELVLMNLLRGSGPLGMAGIAPRRGRLIRPLINIHRDRIIAYLDANKHSYHHDQSNDDRRFLRNRIRHELIPQLESNYNPRLKETLQRTARILRDEEEWLEKHIDTVHERLLPKVEESGINIDGFGFRNAPAALQRRILRRGLAMAGGDLKRITFEHVERIRQLAQEKRFPKWLDLPRGLRIRLDAAGIHLWAESADERRLRRQGAQPPSLDYCYQIDCPQNDAVEVHIAAIDARLSLEQARGPEAVAPKAALPGQAFFDLDRLEFPLVLRAIRPGDRIAPLGMAGSQKVSDLLIDRKIEPDMRRRIPVLVSGAKIIWVAGVRTDRTARVRRHTRRLLVGDFCLLK